MKAQISTVLIFGLFLCQKPGQKQKLAKTSQAGYFAVTARDGLNLRVAPNVTAKRLLTLPYLYRGRILEKTERTQEIQGAKGYWLKTEYRGAIGWAFSGFVWLLKNETDSINIIIDEKREFSAAHPPELSALEEISNRVPETPSSGISAIFQGDKFKVDLTKRLTNDYCSGQPVVLSDKTTNRQYTWLVDESGLKNITPASLASDIFVYTSLGLWCSCGAHDVTGIILMANNPQLLQLDQLNLREWETRCEAWEGWVPAHTQVRFSQTDHRLYLLIKAPICRHEAQDRETKAYKTGRSIGWFIIYEKQGASYVESLRVNSLGVPETYEPSWSNAIQL